MTITSAWIPSEYHVYRVGQDGIIKEELLDVEFTAEIALNNIPQATVSVTGKKPGEFWPWRDFIAICGDNNYQVFFFGPVISTRTQIVAQPEYTATTELSCQGWEAWLDRVYPRVLFQSEGDLTVWQAVNAIWKGGDAEGQGIGGRAAKFQVWPQTIGIPLVGTDHGMTCWVDWDTDSDDTRAGAPTAWSMYQELHAQGFDVFHRPTWDGKKFYSRLVIGGSTETDETMWKNPKYGRNLNKEYVLGADCTQAVIEIRGDVQSTAILVSGGDGYYGIAPHRDSGSPDVGTVEWDYPSVPWLSFAGMLLEAQIDGETMSANADDPEPLLAEQAWRQRARLKHAPVFLSDIQVRFKPGEMWPGDIITIADNGGSQVISETREVSARWVSTGRINSISIDSNSVLFANIALYETNDPSAELTTPTPGIYNASYYEAIDTNTGWSNRLSVGRRVP